MTARPGPRLRLREARRMKRRTISIEKFNFARG
jgi:hypothetical protein